jgi:predicted DNA-binding ArsR family transcriptional regulator
MIVNVRTYIVNDAKDFVYKFKLNDTYKKIFKQDIDSWINNKEICDEDIIYELLNNLDNKFYFEYIDDSNFGYFKVYEIEEND